MAIRDTAHDEIRALRSQVDQLMQERVSPAINDAGKRANAYLNTASKFASDYADTAGKYASDYAGRARGYTEDGADMVSDRVRDQPLIAIGVAAAVGFLFGRITK